jgi:hypothetical protein
MHPVAAAFRDARQLLDVHVSELASSFHLVAPDPLTGGPVQPVEAVELVTAQDLVTGRTRNPSQHRQSVRSEPSIPAKL